MLQQIDESITGSRDRLFLPLLKADQEKRLVYARAATEELDKSREIMDYVTAKPQFQEWSDRFSKATLGKSFGNVRAMHNPRHLAGAVQEIVYHDDQKAVDFCIKVLDPVDWAKVEGGGYTGLSIGGGYLKKWKDPATGATRYTPRIGEVSFVDSPCMPSSLIMELQKADGTTEEVMLKGVARSFAELLPPPTFAQLNKIGFHPLTSLKEGMIADAEGNNSIHYGYLHGLLASQPKKPKIAKPKLNKGFIPPMAGSVARTIGGFGRKVALNDATHMRGKALTTASTETPQSSTTFGFESRGKHFGGNTGSTGAGFSTVRGKTFKQETLDNAALLLKSAAHPGFARAAASIENRQGISAERAHAILAAGARRASKGAVKANPRLRRVSGVGKQELIASITDRLTKAGGMLLQPDNGMSTWMAGEHDQTQSTPWFGSLQRRKALFPKIAGATGSVGVGMFGKGEDLEDRMEALAKGQELLFAALPDKDQASIRAQINATGLLEAVEKRGPKAPDTPEAREKIRQTLHEFKHGQLHSFRAGMPKRKMPKVSNRKQAIAIALSQARRMGKTEPAFVAALAKRVEMRIEADAP